MVNKVLSDAPDARATYIVVKPQRIPRLIECPVPGEQKMLPCVDARDTTWKLRRQETCRSESVYVWREDQIP